MIQTACRSFNGYKPCTKNDNCSAQCPHRELIEASILVIHLGALGAVVRATSLLKSLHQKHPHALVTWVTDKPADQLLKNHPLIDRVLTTQAEDLLKLKALRFDGAYVIDKSLKASGILREVQAEKVFGFKAHEMTGAILPATPAAEELWQIGLSNEKKFFENKKSEVRLMLEALELPWEPTPEYNLPLSLMEKRAQWTRADLWRQSADQPVIGINTGCSAVIPYKKLTVSAQRHLVQRLLEKGHRNLVLLGGPEDSERNRQIGEGLAVIESPTDRGLRDGLVSVAACDLVITGDSLGMHMAISQKKYVTAWFGPTCAHEIEFYGRGEAILSRAACSPCWKRTCDKTQMCYDQVRLEEIIASIEKGIPLWEIQRSSSFKQPSWEICS